MQQNKILRDNYTPPDFQIPKTRLAFEIHDEYTDVTSELLFTRTHQASGTLFLNGEDLELKSIKLNGEPLDPSRYQVTEKGLSLIAPPDEFSLTTQVRIYPHKNTALEGLYKTKNNYVTQCEPEGFRRITYYLDRPDIMSSYEVTIEAQANQYPHLLSNGNLVQSTPSSNGRTQVKWVDPHKKPCYLFALVAGQFDKVQDSFKTKSGRQVSLECFVDQGQSTKAIFALDSLKKAMSWDEKRFHLEYDLDTYMIVATDDFNAGAMENKGLNIFNSRLVLADPQSATDENYFNIESVVAHEYFHNWTGNRVTLRDWFNLSLKEGLTVFRDQEFSRDEHSEALVRIPAVMTLRRRQFAEDSSPNAHPIYPEYCYAVDNFFTSTIYEKGSEVIRMMQTLVGRPGFNKGMELYFKRHDGQAVTIEDFAKSIFEANFTHSSPPFDLEQFKLWYFQAGTPEVTFTEEYNPESKSLKLNFKQYLPPTPGQEQKSPMVIPLIVSFYKENGDLLSPSHPALYKNSEGHTLIILSESAEQIEISGFEQPPIISINQQFSAPIMLNRDLDLKYRLKLLKADTDIFNKWDGLQQIYLEAFKLGLSSEAKVPMQSLLPTSALEFLNESLQSYEADPYFTAMLLQLPDLSYIEQRVGQFDAIKYAQVLESLKLQIAQKLAPKMSQIYPLLNHQDEPTFSGQLMALRALRNVCLEYLACLPEGRPLAFELFKTSPNMTGEEFAFQECLKINDFRDNVIRSFHQKWKHDSLTLNKWFAAIAGCPNSLTNKEVKTLWEHPDFQKTNPNRVYALLGRWGANLTCFHADTSNYEWLAQKCLELDAINPQVATRIASAFNFCTRVDTRFKGEALKAISNLLTKKLSPNLYEILSRNKTSLEESLK